MFIQYPMLKSPLSKVGIRPPRGAEEVLGEPEDLFGRGPLLVRLQVGNVQVKSTGYPLYRFREYLRRIPVPGPTLFHGGRNILWSIKAPYLRAAIDTCAGVYFRMEPLDPVLGIGTTFHLSPAGRDEPRVEIALTRNAGELRFEPQDIRGHPVHVRIPADAKMEETIHALIRLRQAGATGFTFD
jgi:hypothetical protein